MTLCMNTTMYMHMHTYVQTHTYTCTGSLGSDSSTPRHPLPANQIHPHPPGGRGRPCNAQCQHVLSLPGCIRLWAPIVCGHNRVAGYCIVSSVSLLGYCTVPVLSVPHNDILVIYTIHHSVSLLGYCTSCIYIYIHVHDGW